MTKEVKLVEGKDFWIIFFEKLTEKYVTHSQFFDMLCTISYPFDTYIQIVHSALQEAYTELEREKGSLPDYRIVEELKKNISEIPNETLVGISNTVLSTLKTSLFNRKTKNDNPARLWDKATRLQISQDKLYRTYSSMELFETKCEITHKNTQPKMNTIPLAYLKTALKGKDVAIEVTEQIKEIIKNPILNLMVKSFKKYQNDQNVQNVAGNRYKAFYEESDKLLRNTRLASTISKDLIEILQKILDHRFRGQSFPTFPSLVTTNSCTRFPNIHDDPDKRTYCFRPLGDGWSRKTTILPRLIECKELITEILKKPHPEEKQLVISELYNSLLSYLQWVDIEKITLTDLIVLYDSLPQLLESNYIPNHDYRLEIKSSKGLKTHKYLISPKRIQTNRLIVFIHENESFKEEIAQEHGTTYWYGDNKNGIQDFISYLLVNTEFLPREVIIYHKLVKADLRQKLNNNTNRFFASLKAVIDSAVLFFVDDADIKRSLRKLNCELQHISSTDNMWFISFTMKDIHTSLFHDYYYMLIKGITAWEAKFFENQHKISPIAFTEDKINENIQRIIQELWKGKRQLNQTRKRINVQIMNRPWYQTQGESKWSDKDLFNYFGEAIPLYKFDKIGNMAFYYYTTENKDRRIAIPKTYLERFLSNRKDLSRAIGALFQDKWYYTSHSLKNTSTAGYILTDKSFKTEIMTSDVILVSLASEWWYGRYGEEPRYIHNLSIFSHLSEAREVQIVDESYVDDSFGRISSETHYQLASNVLAKLSSEKIPIIVKIKRGEKSEGIHHLLSQSIEEKRQVILNDPTLDWVYEKNKARLTPIFLFLEKALLSSARDINKIVSKRRKRAQLVIYIEEPLLSLNSESKKLIGILVYGSRRDEKLGEIIRKDLNPSMIFTVVPTERQSEDIYDLLKKIICVLPSYGDEKGGVSLASLSRLFHLPYPDPPKLIDPTLFIKGVNRYSFPLELI